MKRCCHSEQKIVLQMKTSGPPHVLKLVGCKQGCWTQGRPRISYEEECYGGGLVEEVSECYSYR